MQSKSLTPEAVLRGYFHAKDENRPHLLEDVFASNAELIIHNQSANIDFPAFTQGRSAIAEVLVRSFALSNENVYSFYSAVRARRSRVHLSLAGWHVGAVLGPHPSRLRHLRVVVRPQAPHMASRLVVTIEAMQVLPVRSPRGCSNGYGR